MKILYITMIVILAAAFLCWIEFTHPSTVPELAPVRDRIVAFIDKLRGAARSKTVWFNAVALAFVGQLPAMIDYAAQNLPALQPYLPANHYTTIIGAITIANLILRFKTTTSLAGK